MSYGTFGMNFLSWHTEHLANHDVECDCSSESISKVVMSHYLTDNHGFTQEQIDALDGLDSCESLEEYENYLVPLCPCDMCRRQRGEII